MDADFFVAFLRVSTQTGKEKKRKSQRKYKQGTVIKNNEKNGVVYHNIVDFFEVDIEDFEEEDDEEYKDDFEEKYDDEYEDNFEDFDRITSRRRNSKTIPRREEKRRKTNRR